MSSDLCICCLCNCRPAVQQTVHWCCTKNQATPSGMHSNQQVGPTTKTQQTVHSTDGVVGLTPPTSTTTPSCQLSPLAMPTKPAKAFAYPQTLPLAGSQRVPSLLRPKHTPRSEIMCTSKLFSTSGGSGNMTMWLVCFIKAHTNTTIRPDAHKNRLQLRQQHSQLHTSIGWMLRLKPNQSHIGTHPNPAATANHLQYQPRQQHTSSAALQQQRCVAALHQGCSKPLAVTDTATQQSLLHGRTTATAAAATASSSAAADLFQVPLDP